MTLTPSPGPSRVTLANTSTPQPSKHTSGSPATPVLQVTVRQQPAGQYFDPRTGTWLQQSPSLDTWDCQAFELTRQIPGRARRAGHGTQSSFSKWHLDFKVAQGTPKNLLT